MISVMSRQLVVVSLLAVLSPAAARGQVINFDDLAGSPNWTPLGDGYGSTAEVAVSNRTRTGFGNSALNSPCIGGGYTSSNLRYWKEGYTGLEHVAFACGDNSVAEFEFVAASGYDVFLESLDLGSYDPDFISTGAWVGPGSLEGTVWPGGGTGPIGMSAPTRFYDLRVYDGSWTLLASQSGTLNSATVIELNVSGSDVLYLQLGLDFNVGMDNIGYEAMLESVVPEPVTAMLLGTGLAGVFAARRRKREIV